MFGCSIFSILDDCQFILGQKVYDYSEVIDLCDDHFEQFSMCFTTWLWCYDNKNVCMGPVYQMWTTFLLNFLCEI